MSHLPVQAQTSADELCVQLRDLMSPLQYTKIDHLRARFETFIKKTGGVHQSEPDVFINETNGNTVGTYRLSKSCAVAFILYAAPRLMPMVLDANAYTAVMAAVNSLDVEDIRPRPDLYVYAARAGSGDIKVGISQHPEKRIKQLSISSPSPLQLVYVRRADKPGYASETEAHRALVEYHIHSEWFTADALPVLRTLFPPLS